VNFAPIGIPALYFADDMNQDVSEDFFSNSWREYLVKFLFHGIPLGHREFELKGCL
jgi:hypothetical protein